jgi:hypothetical protein
MKEACIAAATIFATTAAFAETINFDTDKPGALPSGWQQGVTGKGTPKWAVQTDGGAPSKPNVLQQSGSGTFPWCVMPKTAVENGFVEVRFKSISGREDQAGGVIWRCKDADNYYIARANALEDNVCIYHTVNGRRVEKKRINTKVAAGKWHTFRVDFKDNYFVVTFDGKKAFGWKDDTFKDAGKVGLWTKADSTTLFDDFSYGPESKVSKADIDAINKGTKAPGQVAAEGDDDDHKK